MKYKIFIRLPSIALAQTIRFELHSLGSELGFPSCVLSSPSQDVWGLQYECRSIGQLTEFAHAVAMSLSYNE